MSLILHIETATGICSTALSKDGNLVALKETIEPNMHSTILSSFIDQLLKENNVKPSALSAISVSIGPGSYTGLRIGVSTAKGLCYALSIPLIAINTLAIMCEGIDKSQYPANSLFCPMIDARRMEVYHSIFDSEKNSIQDTAAKIIDQDSFQTLLDKQTIVFFGDGANKCKTTIHHANALFDENFKLTSTHQIDSAFKAYQLQQFADVAYIEPLYLKDFVAGAPSVKGLH